MAESALVQKAYTTVLKHFIKTGRAPHYAELAERLDACDGIAALEVNISCPNVKAGGIAFGAAPQAAALELAVLGPDRSLAPTCSALAAYAGEGLLQVLGLALVAEEVIGHGSIHLNYFPPKPAREDDEEDDEEEEDW